MSRVEELRRLSIRVPRYEGEMATAIHEAGHAVVAHSLGRRVSYLSVIVDVADESAGHCQLGDLPNVKLLLGADVVLTPQQKRKAEQGLNHMATIIDARWDDVNRLAVELRRERVLSGSQVRAIVRETPR